VIEIYGLKNCDTCRKAMKWLANKKIEYVFHDVRKDELGGDTIINWIEKVGTEQLLNRRGTTWRNLSENEKGLVVSGRIVDLLIKYPALIKRPVFVFENNILVGFKKDTQNILTNFRTAV